MLPHSFTHKATRTIEASTEWIFFLVAVLAPIAVFPFLDGFLFSTKVVLVQSLALYVGFCYIIKSCLNRSFSFPQSRISGMLLLFAAVVTASSITTQPFPLENLSGVGGVLLSLVMIALFGSTLISPSTGSQRVVLGLKVGTIVLSVLTILQTVGFKTQMLITPFLNQQAPLSNSNVDFSLAGTLFIAWQVTLVGLLTSIILFIRFKQKDVITMVLLASTAICVALGAWHLRPGSIHAPIVLHPLVNWSVAIDVMKTPKGALVGVGPEQFLSAYTRFRPAWANTTPQWNIQFLQGTSVLLTFLATLGLLGTLIWIGYGMALVSGAWKAEADNKTHRQDVTFVATLAALFWISQVFFPLNALIFILEAIAIAAWLSHHNMTEIKPTVTTLTGVHIETTAMGAKRSSQFFVLFLGLLGAAGLAYISWFFGKSVATLYYTQQATQAMTTDTVANVYEHQKQTVRLSPLLSGTHRTYALTNMAIATALANKADATEQDKQQAIQLVQQSIREARAAATINPTDFRNLKALAQIYANLIGSAKDAQQWTVSAYVATIQVAPTDPTLRVELGGLFFDAAEYDQALSLFQQAIELKPDYANAYYNAANTLVKLNRLAEAKRVYQQTLVLLPSDSEGYMKASKELQELDIAIQKQEAMKKTDTQVQDEKNTQPSLLEENLNTSLEETLNQPTTDEVLEEEPTSATPASPTPTPTTDS